MQELPTTADGVAQWCKDVFVTKVGLSIWKLIFGWGLLSFMNFIYSLLLNTQDAFLENYRTKDLFSNLPLQDIGRPKKSLFVSLASSVTAR